MLGKGDGQTAALHKNSTRSTILPYGDTPTGTFNIVGGFVIAESVFVDGLNSKKYVGLR